MDFRRLFIIVWLAVIALGIGYLFWQQEIRYLTPTPLPDNYNPVAVNSTVPLAAEERLSEKATFMHFFNPDCPCSRFNIRHFNYLVSTYKNQVDFRVVIPAHASIEEARKMLDEDLPVISDKEDAIANASGVYATPQAVIINAAGALYYRGNYNKSRYCTQKETNYAEIALNDLLNGLPPRDYGLFASRAYGCELSADQSSLIPFINL